MEERTYCIEPNGIHTLTPNDPAIVFEKIVIDGREGKKKESQGNIKV